VTAKDVRGILHKAMQQCQTARRSKKVENKRKMNTLPGRTPEPCSHFFLFLPFALVALLSGLPNNSGDLLCEVVGLASGGCLGVDADSIFGAGGAREAATLFVLAY